MNSDKEKIKIKVCGMTSKENIKKVLDIGVDMIGLIFVPTSKRFLKDKKAIIDFVSQIVQVKKVGVFVNPSAALVSKQIDQYKLDYIQLHGQESADFCSLFYK
jgi:phosphoribosylanthranilate isomerase